jgi:hypothetical protein
MTKRCARCQTEKPVTEFCRDQQKCDGLTSYCRDCLRDRSKAYYAALPRAKAADLRRCRICTKEFSKAKTGGRRYYCSEECFRIRKKRTPVIELRTCRGCQMTFEARTHGQARKMYCSTECYAREKRRRTTLTVQACRSCDQPFTRAERGNKAQFCSDAAKRCTAREERATCDNCGLWFLRQPNSEITTCLRCRQGKPVKHGANTYSNRGCRCPECTNAHSAERLRRKYEQVEAGIPLDVSHRARARRFGVENQYINKLSVFERDDWRCGICGDPVDREAEWPAPMSVSLDHIVPLSAGGGHVYDNVQCAHLQCNLRKNDLRKKRRIALTDSLVNRS